MNSLQHVDFYVASHGCDTNPGTQEQPFAAIERAQEAVRQLIKNNTSGNITVCVREGTYYLEAPLVFGPEDSGTKDLSVVYASYPGEKPTISGGKRINCSWKPYRDGIMMCELPDVRDRTFGFKFK